MYDVVSTVIGSGKFALADILHKIDILWTQGDLSDDERDKLIAAARKKADPAASYAPLQTQVDALRADLDALTARVAALEPTPEQTEPAEEWPEYKQPLGAHDAYHAGDKVTWNGKRYTCVAPDGVAVVWSPSDYPAYWQAAETGTESDGEVRTDETV